MITNNLPIIIILLIAGIIIIAWRIRASKDKENEWQRAHSVVPKKAKENQMQIAIDKLENKQAELSKKVDQLLEAKPNTTKPKDVEKKTVKASPKKASPKKADSKPKVKKA